MPLHLTCASEVITLPNERVIALFHQFFLQFRHIEIDQKAQNTTTSRLLSHAFYKYSQLLICIPVDLAWVYQSITRKRSDKQWFRFQEGWGGSNHPPPLARYVSQNGLTIGGLKFAQLKFYEILGRAPPPPCKKCEQEISWFKKG